MYANNAQQVIILSLKPGDLLGLPNGNMGCVKFGSKIPWQIKETFGDQSYYLTGVWLQQTGITIQILNLETTGEEASNNPDHDAH
ncbi:uncharacterized protein N7498_004448 [Penicillium cinerascens]|uniref:Uncharacterized protein n=1 Tax=Penicillium cinerascens TaxID=70096 RepID=A0A9W9N3Z3_9EURO|nr:uncharacterized protein N7498_004448 [Penicillium cinerascens]KAJ5212802.1 hypothetical protein N7498_004448 [Penicillium cinerascens]